MLSPASSGTLHICHLHATMAHLTQQSVDTFSDQIHQGAGLSWLRGEPGSAKRQSGQALRSRDSQVDMALRLQQHEETGERGKRQERGMKVWNKLWAWATWRMDPSQCLPISEGQMNHCGR